MSHRPTELTIGLVVLAATVASPVLSATMSEVIAPVRQMSTCQLLEGESPPVSLQAGMFFHYDTDKEKGDPGLRPVAKQFESFQCGRRTATIYLYEYADESAARNASSRAMSLIWGGDKPSSHHPEAVFTIENILVVISTKKPRELEDAMLRRSESKED